MSTRWITAQVAKLTDRTITHVGPELRGYLKEGGHWVLGMCPFVVGRMEGSPREQYRALTLGTRPRMINWDMIWKIVMVCLLAKAAFGQQVKATVAAPTYSENQIVPLSVDLAGTLRTTAGGGGGGGLTDAQLRATPVPVSGTFWQSLQPVSGTFWQTIQPISAASLPLPAGASTAAKQPALGTAGASSTDVITVQGIAGGTPQPVSGTVTATGPLTDAQLRATPVPVSGTITANAGTNLNTSGLALEAGGNLAKLPLAQGAATAGQTGPLVQAAVTTGAPTYVTGQTSPLSLTVGGALRVDTGASGGLTDAQLRATPVPVSGTVTANAGTNLNTSALALEAGGNLAKIPVAQASTTAGQSGPLNQGAVTTGAPTYTTGQTSPLSLTVGGALRVDTGASGGLTDAQLRATPVPVSGTVTANAGTNLNTSALALEAGGNLARLPLAQASTTAGQFGPLTQGAVTTAAPTYVTGQTSPLSITTAGALRVDTGGAGGSTNLTQIAGVAVVTGGLAGTLGVGGTAANNAAITQNPLLIGVEALSTQPVAATTGNQRRLVGSLDGAQYVREGGPVQWSCSLDALSTTLLQCQAAPGAGLRLFITDIMATTTAVGESKLLLRYGTGANCATGTTSVFPAAATVARIQIVGNTAGPPTIFAFRTPLIVIANNALCAVTATNPATIQISGYTAP